MDKACSLRRESQRKIYEIRDGESTIAGDILSNVISRVGLGGGEPLKSLHQGYPQHWVSVEKGVRAVRGWEFPPPRLSLPTLAT